MNSHRMRRATCAALLSASGLIAIGHDASGGPLAGASIDRSTATVDRCSASSVYYVGGQPVDQEFIESVALWDVLDWGTCSTTDYDPSAGRYHFTEASGGYASLRTYLMTTDECTSNPCKSGYRYTIRYRTDLDIDSRGETIEGEMKIYLVRQIFAVPQWDSVASATAGSVVEVLESVYAGKVTISVDTPAGGNLGEFAFDFEAFDALDHPLGEASVTEMTLLNLLCGTVADNVHDEIEARVNGALKISGIMLEEKLYEVADAAVTELTASGLDSNDLIATAAPITAQSVDAVLRSHAAIWLCDRDDRLPGGPGTITGGPGTVVSP